MRINPIIYGVLVLIVFFGIILGFQAAGVWSTSGKVDSSGQSIQPSAADVNTIKGWMTLEQIMTTYKVSLAELLTQFDLPADTPPTTTISELESESFSVTNLRTWLQSRLKSLETPQPVDATPFLTEIATLIPEVLITVSPVATEHVAPDKVITGKTTFQELLDWGVSLEMIQKVIGDDMPEPSMLIKDYAMGKGLEFTTIKRNYKQK